MKNNKIHNNLIANLDLEPLFRGHWSKFGKYVYLQWFSKNEPT